MVDRSGPGSTRPRPPSQIPPWAQISRASQFDAAQIDEGNISVLKEQLKKVFSMKPEFFSKFEPELMACLQLCVWRFSIWLDKPTPGNASKGLRYRNEGAFQSLVASGKVRTGLEGPGLTLLQKFGFLFTMVVPYGWARLQTLPIFEHISGSQQAARVLQNSEKVYKVTNLAHFLLFLHTGRYRSVVDRVLNARLVYQRPNTVQATSTELLNRQLVWSEFSELMLILLPVLKRVCTWSFFNRRSDKATVEKDTCPLCGAKSITIPYVARPCGHLYCYYCLKTRCTSNRAFRCVTCNEEVTSMQPRHSFKNHEQGLVDHTTAHAP